MKAQGEWACSLRAAARAIWHILGADMQQPRGGGTQKQGPTFQTEAAQPGLCQQGPPLGSQLG